VQMRGNMAAVRRQPIALCLVRPEGGGRVRLVPMSRTTLPHSLLLRVVPAKQRSSSRHGKKERRARVRKRETIDASFAGRRQEKLKAKRPDTDKPTVL
jgi:hypothetical protein